MAKFANVTYGYNHPSEQMYTYVVNDDVKEGMVIQPSVRHYRPPHKVFATTAVVQQCPKTTSTEGKEIREELDNNGIDVSRAKTGKELGLKGERDERGRFTQGRAADLKTMYNDTTESYQATGDFYRSKGVMAARGGNIQARIKAEGGEPSGAELTQKAMETYDTYSQKFIGK